MTWTSAHSISAISSRTSDRSPMDPRAIFCSVTCHKGPMAGLAQKMNPGPFAR